MKPTQEQLNDTQWWDDYAKEGFDYIFFNKNNLRTEFADKDGVLPNDNRLIVTENAWVLLAKRPTKPVFVPEVGVECEGFTTDLVNNWKWKKVEPLKETSTGEFACLVDGRFLRFVDQFRPIKSEREEIVNKALEIYNCGKYSIDMAEALYDAGMLRLKETTK